MAHPHQLVLTFCRIQFFLFRCSLFSPLFSWFWCFGPNYSNSCEEEVIYWNSILVSWVCFAPFALIIHAGKVDFTCIIWNQRAHESHFDKLCCCFLWNVIQINENINFSHDLFVLFSLHIACMSVCPSTGWLQRSQQWNGKEVTTSYVTFGLWASLQSNWLNYSPPCLTCTPWGRAVFVAQ